MPNRLPARTGASVTSLPPSLLPSAPPAVLMCQAQLHWEAGAYGRCQEALQRSAEFCSDTPAWRLNLAHSLVAQEGGPARLAEAAELYESLLSHFAGGGDAGPAAGWPAGEQESVDGGGQGAPPPPAPGGSLLDVPPPALANLCVCYVVGAQNEAAEELLRRLEEEVGAAEEAAAAAAAAGAALPPPPPHLAVTNLAIGTLYCSKGGWVAGGWVDSLDGTGTGLPVCLPAAT